MIEDLDARLAQLAARQEITTYGALAADLSVEGPGRIAKLTAALEHLMEEDAASGQPLRAALVVGRANDGLPGLGFFEKAAALGFDVTDPAGFHRSQLLACYDREKT